MHKNVILWQFIEGDEEYIKHDTPFTKNKIVLTPTNLIKKDATYGTTDIN